MMWRDKTAKASRAALYFCAILARQCVGACVGARAKLSCVTAPAVRQTKTQRVGVRPVVWVPFLGEASEHGAGVAPFFGGVAINSPRGRLLPPQASSPTRPKVCSKVTEGWPLLLHCCIAIYWAIYWGNHSAMKARCALNGTPPPFARCCPRSVIKEGAYCVLLTHRGADTEG
jgi:hypothetical protein